MNKPLRAAVAIASVAGAAALGFAAFRWFADSQDSPAAMARAGESASAREAAEPAVDGAPPAQERRLAAVRPEFALRDRSGRMRSISEWDGKSLVINFWATWCAPCRREIPMLRELHAARANENVEVIGVAVDFRDAVLAYADAMKIDYPVLIGEQDGLDAVEAFGIGAIGFPFTVFTDNEGRVVTAHLGELHREEADAILDVVALINKGSVSLQEGQQRIASGLKDAARKKAAS